MTHNLQATGYRRVALFKLSQVHGDLQRQSSKEFSPGISHTEQRVQGAISPNVREYRVEAEKSLVKLVSDAFSLYDDAEYDYESLLPYMLW